MTQADDFQRRASEEGRAAEDMAKRVVSGAGFSDVEQNRHLQELGPTINLVARDVDGNEWYFDVSGSFTSDRAGLIRTDTVWKTLGRASVLYAAGLHRLILLTTNLPPTGSVGDKALHAASHTFVDAIEMLTVPGKLRLKEYALGRRTAQLPLPGYREIGAIYGDELEEIRPGEISIPVGLVGDSLPVQQQYAVTQLPYRFKVFLPSQDMDGNSISDGLRSETGRQIIESLNRTAGGCTVHEAVGSWVDPISGVAFERVTAIEAYSRSLLPDLVVRDIVSLILNVLHQAAVAIILGDRMFHITRDAGNQD